MAQEYTITLGELLDHLKLFPPDTDAFFGNGNLQFYRTKMRGDNMVQIEFSQHTWPSSCAEDNAEYERRKPTPTQVERLREAYSRSADVAFGQTDEDPENLT